MTKKQKGEALKDFPKREKTAGNRRFFRVLPVFQKLKRKCLVVTRKIRLDLSLIKFKLIVKFNGGCGDLTAHSGNQATKCHTTLSGNKKEGKRERLLLGPNEEEENEKYDSLRKKQECGG
jgi:hypothetical protein